MLRDKFLKFIIEILTGGCVKEILQGQRGLFLLIGRSGLQLGLEFAMMRTYGLQDSIRAGRVNLFFDHRLPQDYGRALQHLGVLAIDVGADHAGLMHSSETVLHDGATELGHQTCRILFVSSCGGTWLVMSLRRGSQVDQLEKQDFSNRNM